MPPIPRPILGGGEAYRQPVDRPRGGREPRPQRTLAQAQAHLDPQLLRALDYMQQLPEAQRGERVVLESTLLPKYIANSHFPGKTLSEADLEFVGTRVTPFDETGELTKTLLVAGSTESLKALREILYDDAVSMSKAQKQLLRLDTVALPDPASIVRVNVDTATRVSDGRLAVDAVLHPAVSHAGVRTSRAQDVLLRRFLDWAGAHHGEVLADHIRVVGGLVFVPLLAPAESCRAIASFNGVRVLRDLAPVTSLPLVGTTRALEPGVDPKPPSRSSNATALKIYVFDGPVEADHPYLDRFVTVRDLAQPRNVSGTFEHHGTWVAGAALHGPIVPIGTLPTPVASVEHVVIAPRDGDPAHMPWALGEITRIVRAERPKIVTVCVAPAHHVEDDDEPHDWTVALDELAHELDVLFVVAVGNSRATPARRIQVPADMVNGLAVGACDQRSPLRPWGRAPYSHVGPGRAGARIRPSGVMFGGTDTSAFHVAHPQATIARGSGTSLSAPVVARALSGLAARLGDHASAPTLRAFASHFAEPPDAANFSEVGHGRIPEDFGPMLACDADEITVLYQDDLARNEVVSVPLPVPARPPRGMYEVHWTLAYASPVSGEDAFEYTQAGIELSFRPNVLATTMKPPDANDPRRIRVHLERNRAKVQELLDLGWRITGVPQSRPLRPERPERQRREAGKWESLVRGSDRLNAKSLNRPVLWLDYLARANGDIWRGENVPSLPYSLLITVRGPPDCDLYATVRSELDLLVEVPVEIEVGVDIHVDT